MRRYMVDRERPVMAFTLGSLRMCCSTMCSFEKVKRTPERVRDHHGKMISEQSYSPVTGVTVIFLSCESFFLNVETSRVWMGDE